MTFEYAAEILTEERNALVKCISKFLLSLLAFGLILSCARTPQRIELHPVYAVPRGTPLGPGIPLGVAEGLDVERVRESTVRVVYGEGASKIISSGFFVANDKIVTNIHVVVVANLDSLHVRGRDTDYAIQGVIAFDAQNDLVVLKVSGEGVPLVLGNSDAVNSGETVFCVGYVGYPVDRFNVMKNTVLPGRLNGVWLRVTPNIPAGNSGGPVLNAESEVIGINVMGSGLTGYAIGSNVLRRLLDGSGLVETLAQWQTRDPIRAYLYLGQALGRFYAADYAGVIHALDKFIELNPMHVGISMIYNNRGHAKTLLGHSKFAKGAPGVAQLDYRAAIQDLDKAISLNPEDITAYFNRGYARTLLGHSELIRNHVAEAQQYYRAAIEDFDKAIGADPGFPAYAERGAVKVALGMFEANRGHTEKAQQHYQEGIEDFEKAIGLDREDAYAYITRGYTKIRLGDFETGRGNTAEARKLYKAAIIDCTSAIRLDSENPYCYHTRGVAKTSLDDYSGAIDDFDKTINLNTDFARAYYNRALAKEKLGQKDSAKADFEKAKKLDLDVRK